uniref:Metal transporter n=1 Tax=Oryza glumipatula TaxID=40148 RepID=A0A0D9Y986_9ORYZ
MEEGAKIGREHEQQQQQHGRVNGSGRVAAVGGGSGGGGDEIEIEVAAAAGASPSRQHGGLHGDVQAPTWKRFLAHVGPGFVISIAYLDPSNLQTDLVAGSSHRYSLLWVLLFGFIFVLTVQSLAANLGIITGRHLAELCMGEYPKYVKYCLWLLAELGVIAATIPGVLGTALAYNMLLHIPFWAGVLACGTCTFLILGYWQGLSYLTFPSLSPATEAATGGVADEKGAARGSRPAGGEERRVCAGAGRREGRSGVRTRAAAGEDRSSAGMRGEVSAMERASSVAEMKPLPPPAYPPPSQPRRPAAPLRPARRPLRSLAARPTRCCG